MTERRDDPLERRLETWFEGEVTRAGRDLVVHPVRGGPARARTRPRMALFVAAAVVTVVAVGGTLAVGFPTRTDDRARPSTKPSVTSAPTPAPEPQVGADLDVTGWYWDGVPASIEGVVVVRPSQFPGARRFAGTDLIGGWVGTQSCPVAAPACDVVLSEASDGDYPTKITTTETIPPAGSIAVYRLFRGSWGLVWAADPRAFVDDRSPDGIPSHLDGVEVHPVSELATVLARTPDDRPILVGGWFRQFGLRCAYPGPDRQEHVLLPFCNGAQLARGPGVSQQPLIQGVSVVLDGLDLDWGRVVLRVHHRDARSASCLPEQRELCEAAIVVEGVEWSGDQWTETSPLTIADVVERLQSAKLLRNVVPLETPGDVGGCRPDFPPETWVSVGEATTVGEPVGRVLVFPSVADRERVGATLRTDGFSGRGPDGMPCTLIVDGLTAQAWFAVDNVILELPYRLGEDATETRQRIDALEAALRIFDID